MGKIIKSISKGYEEALMSKFYAEAGVVEKEEDFPIIYDSFKKRYPKADHYPYAYKIDDSKKANDDGEPSGTGGRALLSLLDNNDINHGYIIVARFFGGSKLGMPRLRRCFISSGEDALNKADYLEEREEIIIKISGIDYSKYDELVKLSKKEDIKITNEEFNEAVNLIMEGEEKIISTLENDFSLKGKIDRIGKKIARKEVVK